MKTVKSVFLVLLITSSSAIAQVKHDFNAMIDSVLIQAKQHAVNVQKVNWDTLRAHMYQYASIAQTSDDLKPAFAELISALNDKQATIRNSKGEVIAAYTVYKDAEIHDVVTSSESQLTSKVLRHNVRYLKVPSFNGNVDINKEASAMRSIVDTLSKENASAWIVDLRGVSGSNFQVLMAGLGPLLGEGLVASEIDRTERILKMYEIHNGRLYVDQHIIAHFATPVDLSESKIAVLIDENTSAAAEVFALALKGRKQTRVFGAASAGKITITKDITVSGYTLTLSSGYYQDRRGSIYKDSLFPHAKADKHSLTEEGLITEATKWLREQPATNVIETASIDKNKSVAIRP
jgi:carboxyl-terminal processing protease